MLYLQRVAVIGAGVHGIAAAKTFMEHSHDVAVFEGAEDLGGVWRPGNNYPGERGRNERQVGDQSSHSVLRVRSPPAQPPVSVPAAIARTPRLARSHRGISPLPCPAGLQLQSTADIYSYCDSGGTPRHFARGTEHPPAAAVYTYLRDYAAEHGVTPLIRYEWMLVSEPSCHL